MDSILVVCYSYSGTTRRLARLLCSHHGWPLGEIVDRQPRAGASGTVRCVLDSLLRRKPAVRYEGPDPQDFHTLILMSPVWVYGLAGPMRSFMASHRDELRRVAMILTMNSGGASNAIGEAARILGHAPILVAAFTSREIEDGTGTTRLLAFGEQILPPSASRQAAPGPALATSG